MEEEIWKDIEGWKGLYQVSSMGRVKSLERVIKTRNTVRVYKERILSTYKSGGGYHCVKLYNTTNGKKELKFIHKLVAEAYIPNPDNKKCVDHINGDKELNATSNLRWCTQQENNNFELYRKHQTNNPFKSKRVFQYTSDGSLVRIWKSTMDCQRSGFQNGNVGRCCNGRQKQYKGYRWSYKPLQPLQLELFSDEDFA